MLRARSSRWSGLSRAVVAASPPPLCRSHSWTCRASEPDLTSAVSGARLTPRLLALGLVAIALGTGIGSIDSRPGWDDTGVTAGLLILAAALVSAIDGHRPWLWALLVGLP